LWVSSGSPTECSSHLVLVNLVVLVIQIALGILLMTVECRIRTFLIASIVLSLISWYTTEAFGMIFTSMATDFNSGLLLLVIALAYIPKEGGCRRQGAGLRASR
jgi:hypothetical protein